MLTYLDIHLAIEQGLTLGMFSERAVLHEQIDAAFEHVIARDVTRLQNLTLNERNALDKQIAKALSSTVHAELVKEDRYYSSEVSTSFLTTDFTTVTLVSNTCTTDDRSTGYYKAISSLVTYNGTNYTKDKIFKVTNTDLFTYGQAKRLITKDVNGILLDAELQDYFTNSSLFSKSSPLVSFRNNKVLVEYKRNDGFPVEIHYYALNELPTTSRLDWCKQKVLNLPDNLVHYYIDLVIAYIAVINKHEQQNIVNLKTETLK